MSIEEKAKESAIKYAPDLNYNQQYMKCGVRLGANWMLEKAFYWLKDNANDYAITAETDSGLRYATISCDLFDDFRKAMEE